MKGVLHIFLFISFLLLATLLVLRFLWPELVIHRPLGYALSLTWPFALFLGLQLWSNLSSGTGSLGTVIVSISTAIIFGATAVVLNLGFFDTAPTKQSIEVVCVTATPIVFLVWLVILWRSNRKP